MRRFFNLVVRWLFPMAVGAAIVVGAMSILQDRDVRHPVIPVHSGILYRSGQLDQTQLVEEIRNRGIRTVVNLGSKNNWDVDICRRMGVKYLDLPVGDCWNLCGCVAPGQEQAPASPFDLTPLWNVLDDPNSHPVLIHCWGGIHRTGVVAAMYRIERQGWRPEDAIRELDLYGFESKKDKYDNVADYLRTYHAGRGDAPQTAAAHSLRK